jgi:hypothetical protein
MMVFRIIERLVAVPWVSGGHPWSDESVIWIFKNYYDQNNYYYNEIYVTGAPTRIRV